MKTIPSAPLIATRRGISICFRQPCGVRAAAGARLPGGVTNTVDNLVSSAGSLASDLSNNEVNNLLNNATATATGLVNQVEGIATYLL